MGTGPFSSTAGIYDVVYQHLDYTGTAGVVAGIVRDRRPDARSLLDVSCGTGLHLAEFREMFDDVAGADIDDEMLIVARDRLGPDIPLHLADYTDFELGRTFDAVTCMFSSIGYAHTSDRLDSAIAAMARHLKPEGVLVVEPWLLPHMIQPPYVRVLTAEADGVVIARTTRHLTPGDRDATDMEFVYLVTSQEGSQVITERHVMGLYPAERYLAAFERAGLTAEFIEGGTELGRGLVVGVRS